VTRARARAHRSGWGYLVDAAVWSLFLWRLRAAAAAPPLALLWAGIAAFQASI
jgi:hypothetical protein